MKKRYKIALIVFICFSIVSGIAIGCWGPATRFLAPDGISGSNLYIEQNEITGQYRIQQRFPYGTYTLDSYDSLCEAQEVVEKIRREKRIRESWKKVEN